MLCHIEMADTRIEIFSLVMLCSLIICLYGTSGCDVTKFDKGYPKGPSILRQTNSFLYMLCTKKSIMSQIWLHFLDPDSYVHVEPVLNN